MITPGGRDRLTDEERAYYRRVRVHCDHCGHPKASRHAEHCPDAPPRRCATCAKPWVRDPDRRHYERCPERPAVKRHRLDENRARRARGWAVRTESGRE